MMTPILLLIFCFFVIAHAYEHANDKTVEHEKATLTRFFVGCLVVVSDFFFTGGDWISVAIVSWMVLSLFWDIFDMARNHFTGERLLYIGGTANLDKWGRKSPLTFYFLKFFTLVASIGTYWQYHYGSY